MKRITNIIVATLFIASPYFLFALAQTSRLHDAVRSGKVERVLSALKPWKSLDAPDRHGSTPLGIAIQTGSVEVASLLLGRGAKLKPAGPPERAVDYLVTAVSLGRVETVELLLKNGVGVGSGAALREAARKGSPDMVRLLLAHGAPANHVDASGRSVLFDALSSYPRLPFRTRMEISDLLIKHGADVRARIRTGGSLLDIALYESYKSSPQGDLEAFEYVVSRGFPLNVRDENGATPLRKAARIKHVDAVRLLLKYGADANDGGTDCDGRAQCQGRETALHAAAAIAREYSVAKHAPLSADIVLLLVSNGANVNVRDERGHTPLWRAIRSDNFLGTHQLLKAGANPNIGQPGDRPVDLVSGLENTAYARLLEQFAGSLPDRAGPRR